MAEEEPMEPMAGVNPIVATSPIHGEYQKRLLDEFAGQVMVGLLGARAMDEEELTMAELAERVYYIAEAMLAERERRIIAAATPPAEHP